jgi:hypothetical protein
MTCTRSLLLICTIVLSGCGSAPPASPTVRPTLLPSPTPTIAFPTLVPTATVIPLASPTTSRELAAGAGTLLFQASFTSDEGWLLSIDADGAASLSRESLVIAVSRPSASRYVLVPIPPAADYLFEATIRADLCDAEDEIGLLFRVGSLEDYYRYTLSCGGVARMTRVLGTGAAVLAGPAVASSAIPGSPAENHLAVLARGQTFTFFVNGVEVLQSRDSQLISGGLGIFVRSASQGQTTVAVTSLTVTALRPATTATPTSESG